MISERNFQHIVNTLNKLMFKPVLVLGGHNAQQQPFEKSQNVTVNVNNPLTSTSFLSSVYQYTLGGQHIVGDPEYLAFLDHIRNWIPNESLLNQVQQGRVLCPDGTINPDGVIQAFQSCPDSTILTFTNDAANKLNDLITSTILPTCSHLLFANLTFANLTATPT